MRLASLVLSLALHATLLLVIFFWPTSPLVRLDAVPVLISLVDGALGGNRAPSPILGPQGAPGEKRAPSMPAPQKNEAAPAVPDKVTPIATPKEEPKKPDLKPEPKPEPKPKELEPEAKPIAEKKKNDPPKPDPKPEEPPKTEPTKETKPAVDPVKAALEQARKTSSRDVSPNQGSAVERALAEAKRKAGGFGGGGGGEGDGPGGGGLGDVYLGQVMMAVRPNWGYASATRDNRVCVVRVKVDATGKVLLAQLERSSGNAQYDASAVNAVIRTGASGQFPAPPGPEYYDLLLSFNLNEMMGR